LLTTLEETRKPMKITAVARQLATGNPQLATHNPQLSEQRLR